MDTQDSVVKYGYSPVARDPEVLFKDHPTASGENPKQDPFKFDDIPLPDTEIVREVKEFVRVSIPTFNLSVVVDSAVQGKLNEQTCNHSNRVYIYGLFCCLYLLEKVANR